MMEFFLHWLAWGAIGAIALAISLSPMILAAIVATAVESWLDHPVRRARFSNVIAWVPIVVFFAALFGAIPLLAAVVVFVKTGHF